MKRILAMAVVIGLTSPVWATHNHPLKAKLIKVSFVTAFAQCTAPTTTHKPTLSLPACAPALSTDANPAHSIRFGPTGSASAKLKVGAGDVKIKVKGTGIENHGLPFTGTLSLSALFRMSEHGCGASLTDPCTVLDFPFPVDVDCTFGTCSANTSVNLVVPGAFAAGAELNLEVDQLLIHDGDGDAAFRQGLFVP